MSVMMTDQLRYLTASLREVAQRHLAPDEHVLTAVYLEPTPYYPRRRFFGLAIGEQASTPTRAFILTPERALVLEDPIDPHSTTAEQDYLVADCPLNRIILFELRSHLLDCALTLVLATSNGPERVTVTYNGVQESTMLVAVACMRALIERRPLPASTRGDALYAQERMGSLRTWHATLDGLGMKQEHAVERYLAAGEEIQEWLAVPLIDERTWWQRLGIGAHEQPPGVLVRTDRQLLLAKETRRIVRGEATYGSDAWLMPLEHLKAALLEPGERARELRISLHLAESRETLRLPVPPETAERALALITSYLATRGW